LSTSRDLLGEVVNAVGRRPAPPREDYEYVLESAMAAWRRKVRSRRRRRWALAIAASAAIAAVGGATLLRWLPPRGLMPVVAVTAVIRADVTIRAPRERDWHPLQPSAEVAAGSRLRTGARAGLALRLDDGTSVRLDSRSELELQSATTMRLLSGTLYVDSGPADHSSAHLRIETSTGTATDVGTIFEVRAEPGRLRVRVREGRVQVDASHSATHIESVAGEELELNDSGVPRHRRFAPTDPAWAWAEALSSPGDVENRPLLPFLAWVARETGRKLQFQGPEVEAHAREVVLHGKTRDLTPLQALDLMLSTTDLEYMLSADEAIVIRRRFE